MRILLFVLLLMLSACSTDDTPTADTGPADLIIYGGDIYTVDHEQPWIKALAIKDGRIIATATDGQLDTYQGEGTQRIDLKGAFAMPGFIEGHGHFSGLGQSLINLNFLGDRSWEAIVDKVAARVAEAQPGEWIIGRGWHQEKWDSVPTRQVYGYPYHEALSAISPDHPVLLSHASGHGLMANAKAMELAGIDKETANPDGGSIVRDVHGKAIGVFEENAMGLIYNPYAEWRATLSEDDKRAQWQRGIDLAETECLRRGITSFQDAGSSFEEIDRYKSLAQNGKLDVRLWAMVRHSSDRLSGNLDGLPIVDAGAGFFTCRAIKSELDGALGAFGAWLLRRYRDKPDFLGQNTTEVAEVRRIGELAIDKDMQLCVHAIGDRANRETLNVMEDLFNEHGGAKDRRWRIEHAQHLSVEDIPRFSDLGIIASMQAIHCTSDAPFVVKRLGVERARSGAYAWRSLLDAGAVVTNGTDAPVELVDPLPSLYASVTRKRTDTGQIFYAEQAMSREEAVRSYTLSNAYAAFEEQDKGSLEVGKMADLVILSKNLIRCAEEEILDAEVLYTLVDGEVKYQRD